MSWLFPVMDQPVKTVDLTDKKVEDPVKKVVVDGPPEKKRKLDATQEMEISDDDDGMDAEVEAHMKAWFEAKADAWLEAYGDVAFKFQVQKFNIAQTKKSSVPYRQPVVTVGKESPIWSQTSDSRDAQPGNLRRRKY